MTPEPVPVLALVADLLFASRVLGAARAVGVAAHTARTAAELVDRCRASPPRLVLLDLDTKGSDPVAAIGQLKGDPATSGIPLVAFVSHVREDAIRAAREAGADRVLARSAFVRDLPDLLRAAAQP